MTSYMVQFISAWSILFSAAMNLLSNSARLFEGGNPSEKIGLYPVPVNQMDTDPSRERDIGTGWRDWIPLTHHQRLVKFDGVRTGKFLDKESGLRILRIHEVSLKWFQTSLERLSVFTWRVRIQGLF
jgi:hypothetical protein